MLFWDARSAGLRRGLCSQRSEQGNREAEHNTERGLSNQDNPLWPTASQLCNSWLSALPVTARARNTLIPTRRLGSTRHICDSEQQPKLVVSNPISFEHHANHRWGYPACLLSLLHLLLLLSSQVSMVALAGFTNLPGVALSHRDNKDSGVTLW